jgi:hypothetical protein|tara:strand:- start:286 stop:519 length:234 start_codon:yes stop_codon:yes gene_type:complete
MENIKKEELSEVYINNMASFIYTNSNKLFDKELNEEWLVEKWNEEIKMEKIIEENNKLKEKLREKDKEIIDLKNRLE